MQSYNNLNKQFINGQWVEGTSQKTITNTNPYTQDTIFDIVAASQKDVDNAYTAAQQAYKTWSKTSAEERKSLIQSVINVIQSRRDEIVDWLINESGSARLKASLEVDAALAIITEAGTFPDRLNHKKLETPVEGQESYVYQQALGVISVISSWNFPFHLSMRSVATAIAIGNTVVVKPASDTPVTGGLLIAKLFEEAGLPAGVLNIIIGSGSEIGDYFVQHDVPKMISFTGSTEVGQRVGELAVSARNLKRVALELGGNAPLVVLDDADVDLAVELAVMGRFMHQGQVCISTNRVIVDKKIYDAFVEKIKVRAQSIPYGDPNKEETLVGPIINHSQVNKIKEIIAKAQAQGASLLFNAPIEGNVIPPHILINVNPDFAVAQEESFGPVLPILKAKDEAHALELANDTEYGLSSAVCTGDYDRGLKFALGVEAGMTHINSISVADAPNAPFGGEKNSGLGRFNGEWILHEFSRPHWVTMQRY